jgi:hypothetical protein
VIAAQGEKPGGDAEGDRVGVGLELGVAFGAHGAVVVVGAVAPTAAVFGLAGDREQLVPLHDAHRYVLQDGAVVEHVAVLRHGVAGVGHEVGLLVGDDEDAVDAHRGSLGVGIEGDLVEAAPHAGGGAGLGGGGEREGGEQGDERQGAKSVRHDKLR